MSYHPDNIDSSDPLNPEGSFFRFMGVTGIQQPYYAGVPVATIEQFYQAIKLRLVYELIQEGLISPDTLEDFSGDGSSEDAGIDSDSKRRPGRPRLTEEEKRLRAEQRKSNGQVQSVTTIASEASPTAEVQPVTTTAREASPTAEVQPVAIPTRRPVKRPGP